VRPRRTDYIGKGVFVGDGTTGDGGAELLLLLKFDSVGERVADVGVGERFGALGALVMERKNDIVRSRYTLIY